MSCTKYCVCGSGDYYNNPFTSHIYDDPVDENDEIDIDDPVDENDEDDEVEWSYVRRI